MSLIFSFDGFTSELNVVCAHSLATPAVVIPRSSVHNLQSFACQFNTGKLVTKVLKKSFSDGGANAPPCPPLATPLVDN